MLPSQWGPRQQWGNNPHSLPHCKHPQPQQKAHRNLDAETGMQEQIGCSNLTVNVSRRKIVSEIAGQSKRLRKRLSGRESVIENKIGGTGGRRIVAERRSVSETRTQADVTTAGSQFDIGTFWCLEAALTACTRAVMLTFTGNQELPATAEGDCGCKQGFVYKEPCSTTHPQWCSATRRQPEWLVNFC